MMTKKEIIKQWLDEPKVRYCNNSNFTLGYVMAGIGLKMFYDQLSRRTLCFSDSWSMVSVR